MNIIQFLSHNSKKRSVRNRLQICLNAEQPNEISNSGSTDKPLDNSSNKNTIDEIGAKILKMMLCDARTSLTEIAHKCGITVGATQMRIANLKRKGIIKGEITLVNPHSLGYDIFAGLSIQTFKGKEKEVEKYLLMNYNVVGILPPIGKNNIGAALACRNMNEFTQVLKYIESCIYVKRAENPLIWGHPIAEHPENLLLGKEKNDLKLPRREAVDLGEKAEIDDLDRQIAAILVKESRKSFSKIAKELNISTNTVIQRYKKLKTNVLTLSTIVVDLSKIGYPAWVLIYIKAKNKNKIEDILGQILQTPNVITSIRFVASPLDLCIGVAVRELSDFFELKEMTDRLENIDQVDLYLDKSPLFPIDFWSPLLNKSDKKVDTSTMGR